MRVATIIVDGKRRHLGQYENELGAARAYDDAARAAGKENCGRIHPTLHPTLHPTPLLPI